VFTGIGEFTITKNSYRTRPTRAGQSAQPALDSVLATAGDIGLVVLIHNDMDVPFASDTPHPAYLDDMKALVRRHPRRRSSGRTPASDAWRGPVKHHAKVLEAMLADPAYRISYFDISWDVVAKYFVSTRRRCRPRRH
jgi:hypothetical protein